MGIPERRQTITVEAYLEGEQHSEIRHEYIGGEVYAMAGASEAHNVICGNLYAALRAHLRGKPCRAFISDMKLRLEIAGDDIFYYPDVFVTCDPADREAFYKTQPTVIFEVLSPTTERVDRREKFLSYCKLPTLQEYVMVEQSTIQVSLFRRESDWKPERLSGPEALLRLPSLEFALTLADVYEDVTLEE